MTEAELLALAGAYRKAQHATDLAARNGMGVLLDLCRQGVEPSLVLGVLSTHLGQFSDARLIETEALAEIERARAA